MEILYKLSEDFFQSLSLREREYIIPNKLSEDFFQSLSQRERKYIKQKLLLFTVRTLDGQTFNVIGK